MTDINKSVLASQHKSTDAQPSGASKGKLGGGFLQSGPKGSMMLASRVGGASQMHRGTESKKGHSSMVRMDRKKASTTQMGSMTSGKRSKKGKGKDASMRIVDPETGKDATPKSLTQTDVSIEALLAEQSKRKELPVPQLDDPLDLLVKFGVAALSGSESESEVEKDSVPDTGPATARMGTVTQEDQEEKEADPELLAQKVIIKVTETSTMELLSIPSLKVWNGDAQLLEEVQKENEHYKSVLESHKEKDKFTTRSMETFTNTSRSRHTYCPPRPLKDSEAQVTTWDIEDMEAYIDGGHVERKQEEDDKDDDEPTGRPEGAPPTQSSGAGTGASQRNASAMMSQQNASINESSMGMQSDMLSRGEGSMFQSDRPKPPAGPDSTAPVISSAEKEYKQLMSLPAMAKAARVLERAVLKNEMLLQQLLYRNFVDTTAEEVLSSFKVQITQDSSATESEESGGGTMFRMGASGGSMAQGDGRTPATESKAMEEAIYSTITNRSSPALVPLWTYECPMTHNLNISCMAWNHQNQDLLAVGYGSFEFGNNTAGLLLFWSLKNPRYPQKIIRTKHSVTAVDFSIEHPHLVAAGFYDGSVHIYDIRDKGEKPSMESAHATGKHSEAVWGVQWVCKDASKRGEQLLSVSTDGTVKQWSMKKGLVPHDVMQLKRTPNKAHNLGSSIEGISREASALCFDFPVNDGTQYYAGTEDGLVHMCSVSYNEQTLGTYVGHTGPVYKVRCSPFHPDAFLSCSADWTVKLWDQKNQETPVLTMQSGLDYVMDVVWSPTNACVYAAVTRDGRVEIWDMETSPLDPVVQLKTKKHISCILFSPNAPVIVTGDSEGCVDVFRIHALNSGDTSREVQTQRLLRVLSRTDDRAVKASEKKKA